MCHCSKQFSRIDNLRQHCATVHSELYELNETTIKSLLPVHSRLSQQAGRKHNTNSRKSKQSNDQPPSPPRRQTNTLAPIGEHEASPYHHPSSDDALYAPSRPAAHEHGTGTGRYHIPRLEPAVGPDGREQGWNSGLRVSWNGEGSPPEGLGLIKREPSSSSSTASGLWPEEGGRRVQPLRQPTHNYDEGESEIGSGSDEDEMAYHRRGSDSNVQFGHSWAPAHTQHHSIPPPLHLHPANSDFSAPQHHLHPPSDAGDAPPTSSLLTFPSSASSGPFPSSAQSTQMPTSATAASFGLSPLLDIGGSDSRPGSRPTSRGASLDLSYPLPFGASSAAPTYPLHQHPAFNSAGQLAPNLSSREPTDDIVPSNEHQSTYRPFPFASTGPPHRHEYAAPAPIGRTIYHPRQPAPTSSQREEARPGSPQSMLWGLPQLTPRKHRLASISQQGNQGGIASPQSSTSSVVQWGADAGADYSGGRQPAPKVQRRMSLPYAHHDQHISASGSYSFGEHRSHLHQQQQQYHHHPQHPGMTSYHSDTFVPQMDTHSQSHANGSPHHSQPAVHQLRGFSSTPVHCVSLPTEHHAIPDHSPFSYHAPSRAFGPGDPSVSSSHHDLHLHHQHDGTGSNMFSRPLGISPPLPVGDLSPLSIAPDLPRLGDRHDELPPSSEGSSSLGTTNTPVGDSPSTATTMTGSSYLSVHGGGALGVHIASSSGHHLSSHHSSDCGRSPSPANLEVHLSLASSSFDTDDKRSRIYSGPLVTSAPTPSSAAYVSSLPMQKEDSATSTDSNASFPRRRSLALSVSELMGPSVECGSRPQTSAGVMEVVGERDAEGETEEMERERPSTAAGSL